MKNHSQKISWAAGVVVLAIAAVVLLSILGSNNVGENHSTAGPSLNPENITSPRVRNPSGVPLSDRGTRRPITGKIVQVSPIRVLATVNRREIRLEHLMPVKTASFERVPMDRSIFQSRLQRAIEAELIFQASSDAGIEFTDSQERRLDQIAPKHQSNLEELKPHGLSWDSLNDAQVHFERRMMEAMLLRQNLVASIDAVAPSPDRERQARYEQALQTLLEKLKGSAVIETQDIP